MGLDAIGEATLEPGYDGYVVKGHETLSIVEVPCTVPPILKLHDSRKLVVKCGLLLLDP